MDNFLFKPYEPKLCVFQNYQIQTLIRERGNYSIEEQLPGFLLFFNLKKK